VWPQATVNTYTPAVTRVFNPTAELFGLEEHKNNSWQTTRSPPRPKADHSQNGSFYPHEGLHEEAHAPSVLPRLLAQNWPGPTPSTSIRRPPIVQNSPLLKFIGSGPCCSSIVAAAPLSRASDLAGV
jgi:hypothetical protein